MADMFSRRQVGSARAKRLVLIGLTGLLLLALVLLSSCVTISNVNIGGNVPAGSNHLISMTITATQKADNPVRGVIAIRIPSAWSIKTVSFSGTAFNGMATESSAMENVYSTEWETTTSAGHNGHKDGYKWWVGYTQAKKFAVGDSSTVTIAFDSHGRGGTYLLDFATGIAGPDDPPDTNPAADHGFWQIGSAGTTPTGVLLDQAITLYCFTDVLPGDSYFNAIQGLGAKGVITGYGPSAGGYYEFRGLNMVNRAQYAKFICGALNAAGVSGFAPDEGMTPPVNFPDLGVDNPADLYPHEYVWTAWSHGIVKGYTNGNYQPYIPIQRGHVISMTVRALQAMEPSPLVDPPTDFVQTWGNDMLPEHKANARIAEYNHLLDGIPVASGVASMPRQEVAQVMWNMMSLLAAP
jgi:hypothetical protein